MKIEHKNELLLKDQEEEVVYIVVDDDDKFVVRVTEEYCEILEDGHITKTLFFKKGQHMEILNEELVERANDNYEILVHA